jgi:hypothetical protein
MIRWSVSVLFWVLAWFVPSFASAADPWRLANLDVFPEWLEISGEQRTRIEYMSEQFRAGGSGSDQILSVRTLLRADLRLSRAGRDDDQTALNSGIVNTTDWLQVRLDLKPEDVLGGETRLTLGRMTIDLGNRRLVARNRYRNTINAFTGVDASWKRGDTTLRGLYVLPVQRRPTSLADLQDNNTEADRESLDVVLWSAWAQTKLPWGDWGELYVLGLHEQDASDRPTRNRKLYTSGLHVFRKPSPGALDFDFESIIQLGKSRATAASATELDHRAQFHHAELGYTFERVGSPRLSAFYDYASGDGSASDSDNNRFDPLFGFNRGEYGPTSIFRTFVRSNLSSPGLRLAISPRSDVSAFLAYRAHWLASDNDAWTTSGIVDPSGRSDRFVGSQIETRLRWDLIPANLRLEAGLAHLFGGDFIDEAPNSSRIDNSTYGYFATILTF